MSLYMKDPALKINERRLKSELYKDEQDVCPARLAGRHGSLLQSKLTDDDFPSCRPGQPAGNVGKHRIVLAYVGGGGARELHHNFSATCKVSERDQSHMT